MADTYEQNLAQKSSLTVSDYIRMVGSDNVSYKQGTRSVAELMSTALPYSTVTEVLTWAEEINGRGITYTASSTTDLPTEQAIKHGIAWTYNYVSGGSVWLNVFWTPTNRAEVYYNTKTGTNAWLGWQKMPTRAEVDALNSKTSGTGTAENQYCSYSYTYIKRGNICQLYVEATPKQAITNSTGAANLSDIPKPATSSYSATYDPSSASTICGSAELDGAKNVSFYGARTAGHVYKAGFTYAIN